MNIYFICGPGLNKVDAGPSRRPQSALRRLAAPLELTSKPLHKLTSPGFNANIAILSKFYRSGGEPLKPSTLKLVQIAIFSAIAAVISMIRIPVFFAPSFYQLDLSDAVVLVSGISLGPAAAFLTEFLKVFIKVLIKGSASMGIADLAKFTMGLALVLPASIIYKRNRSFKGACLSLLVGVFCTVMVAALMNYFVLLPTFEALFSISEQSIIAMVQTINPLITDRLTFVLFVVCTFNLVESIVVCILALSALNQIV